MHKYILLAGLIVVLVGLFLGYNIIGLFLLIIGILVVIYGFYSEEKVKETPYVQQKRPPTRRTKRKKRNTSIYSEKFVQCQYCGTKNPKNAAFCAQCGEKL